MKPHTHDADERKLDIQEGRQELKRRAVETVEKPSVIRRTVIAQMPDASKPVSSFNLCCASNS